MRPGGASGMLSGHNLGPRVTRGFRSGIVLGLVIAALGIAVGTATGATTPFQQVIVVNPPSSPVPVAGTVSIASFPSDQQVTVSNWPETQEVSGTIDVGNFPAGPLATKRASADLDPAGFVGGRQSMNFAQMNVTSVIVADGDEDNFDIGIGGFMLAIDHEGNFIEHFPAAFPATGVTITCENALVDCDVSVTVLGY
jgi:hypothetical protein